MNITQYNKEAWNAQVRKGNRWTTPVSAEEIARAKQGEWSVVLTPSKAVPMNWFPNQHGLLKGLKILGLASGGGQQMPLMAAAGAEVTVFDNSPNQLARDQEVADREGLKIRTVEGDMKDLSIFSDESFDFIFHPCSNGFVPDVKPVWKEAYRVLKKGGVMISGFSNPVVYAVDPEMDAKGTAQFRFKLPYSDVTSLTDEERQKLIAQDEPLCFGHTLEDQLGGQCDAGFKITGFFEDSWGATQNAGALNTFMNCFIATRAIK
jgi:SAM-dependent methyltransferase